MSPPAADRLAGVAGEDIRLRPAGPEDSEGIRAVLAASFAGNVKTDPAILAWQYWDNPFGPPRSWVAEAEGRIVAHYAGACLPAVVDGAPVTIAIGIDAATDPGFRGLGLFEQLARAVYTDAGRAGYPVTYCLPNPNSLRGFRKAGGQDLGRARVLVAPLDTGWLAERFGLPGPAARAVVRAFRMRRAGGAEVVTAPPPDLDGLWTEVGAAHGNGVRRDLAWWNWRYRDRPRDPGYVLVETRRAGRLVGAAALLLRQDLGGPMLCLLELLAVDLAAARSLVGHSSLSVAPALGAVGLAATALPGTPLDRWARRSGLRRLPSRLEPQPMHVGLVDNLGTDPELTRHRWSLAWGDLDHI